MISYFKYVDEGNFTVNSSNYSGMVNVVGDNVYTGSILTSNSVLLSATDTFLPQVIQNKINIGPTLNTDIPVSKANILQRDILNQNTIKSIADKLNTNNLNIYANQVTYNPNAFNILSKTQDNLTYTYCITSSTDSFNGKLLPKFRVPNNTDFNKLRSTSQDNNTLFFTTSAGSYYYYSNRKSMKGTIGSSIAPTFTTGLDASTFDHKFIQFNPYNNTLFHTTIDTCIIYNFNYGNGGNTLSLNDAFDISAIRTLTDRRDSVYGANYRTALVQEQGVLVLEIAYVTNQEALKVYTAEELGFDTVNRVVQRFEDDLLVIVGNIGDGLYSKVYDVSQLLTSTTPLYSNQLIGCVQTDVFELANFDSNILIVRRFNADNTLNHLEFRSIVNSSYATLRFSTNSSLGILKVNQIINEQYTPISTSDIVLLPTNIESNSNIIFDIQFSVGKTLNVILVLSDSFSIVNNSILLSLVPINLAKRFIDIDINDNSIGLNINNTFKNIIYDTINLYLSCSKKYKFTSDGVVSGIVPTVLDNITTDDLYIYENEYINVGIMNRVFNGLYDAQQKLSRNTNTPG